MNPKTRASPAAGRCVTLGNEHAEAQGQVVVTLGACVRWFPPVQTAQVKARRWWATGRKQPRSPCHCPARVTAL